MLREMSLGKFQVMAQRCNKLMNERMAPQRACSPWPSSGCVTSERPDYHALLAWMRISRLPSYGTSPLPPIKYLPARTPSLRESASHYYSRSYQSTKYRCSLRSQKINMNYFRLLGFLTLEAQRLLFQANGIVYTL